MRTFIICKVTNLNIIRFLTSRNLFETRNKNKEMANDITVILFNFEG